MAAAAGWLVSPLLQCLSDKAKSYAHEQLRWLPGPASGLDRLSAALTHLHAAAAAVERRGARDQALLAWLQQLKDAVHDADDVLDDFHYDRLRSSLDGPHSKVRRLLSSSFSFCRRLAGLDETLKKLASVLENLTTIRADYANLIHLVELDVNSSAHHHQHANNSSSMLPVDDTVFGRERELAELVGRLVGSDNHPRCVNQRVPVVAVVGDGGVGKTTLAQVAFNHGSIEQHFELRRWVCVPSRADDVELTKEILQVVTDKTYDGVFNFDWLQKLLVAAVESRKFLLVLDDVWDDEERNVWENTERWRKLLAPLQHGEPGSRILVTTRMKMVADMLGATWPLVLEGLDSAEHWLLLKKCALGDERTCEYPQLQEIGKKIAVKLRGSPLAAKVVGGMLSGTRSARDWNNALETEIHSDIVSTLWSSYQQLPQHLKYCFAYCSIFPKNWKFEPKKLIKMWMAQGFIRLEGGFQRSMEEVGREYFNQLLSRSFFQNRRQGHKLFYIMHDLMHDLAQSVSARDCLRVEGDKFKSILPTVRHLSVSSKCLAQLMSNFDLKRLRTLVVFRDPLWLLDAIPVNFFAELKNVRALDLTGCDLTELPETISQLTHLRYMALCETLKRLPESVSKLLHLQALDVPRKCKLDKVPEGMCQLISLRHLDIDTKYIPMISNIGRLVNLQGSVEFHVEKGKGQTLGELKDMNDLHGLLSIKNLENVGSKGEALEAQLTKKEYVKILKLEWNSAGRSICPIMDAEVLDNLQPHSNLEELHITRYKGASSPSWLEDKMLCHLKSLFLTNCRRWEILPPLGQLPSLKVLHIKEMCSVTEIGNRFYGSGMVMFPSLKDLEFDDMPNLVNWTGEANDSLFPRLHTLKLSNCPKLIEVPSLPPTMKKVIVERSQKISHLRLSPCHLSTSNRFILETCATNILNEGFLHLEHLEAIEVLKVTGLQQPLISAELPFLRSLRRLRLCQCDVHDEQWSLLFRHLYGLSTLEIVDCPKITSLPLLVGSTHSWRLEHLCFQDCLELSSLATLGNFILLKSLVIERCPKIKVTSLPAELRSMTSLNKLIISDCPELQSLPEGGLPSSLEFLRLIGCHPVLTKKLLEKQGPEWEKVASIFNIVIH